MGRIKEKKAAEELVKRLQTFLKKRGKAREDMAKDIDDFVSFELLKYNKEYEDYPEDLKEVMDYLLVFGKWKGKGTYFMDEFIGEKEVRKIVQNLRKMAEEK